MLGWTRYNETAGVASADRFTNKARMYTNVTLDRACICGCNRQFRVYNYGSSVPVFCPIRFEFVHSILNEQS